MHREDTWNEFLFFLMLELQHWSKPSFKALTCLLVIRFILLLISTICTLESILVCRATLRKSHSQVFVNGRAEIGISSVSQQGPWPWLWKGPLPSESWVLTLPSYTAIKLHLEWKRNLRAELSVFKPQASGNGKYCWPTPCIGKC